MFLRRWGAYLGGLLEEYGIRDGSLCGSRVRNRNDDRISGEKDMTWSGSTRRRRCSIVQEKERKSGHEILYLLQDMREFGNFTARCGRSSVSAIPINYITEPDDLKQVFHWADNYLDPDGVFIFDFNTEYKYREILGDQTIAENRETCSFIWDNYY